MRDEGYHFSQFRLGPMIGQGTFGTVFLGTHARTGEQVAIKLEAGDGHLLKHEAKFYELLQDSGGACLMHWHGETGDGHYALILELLGPSLEEKLRLSGGRFPMQSVRAIAISLLRQLELMHSKGFVHRDIKPNNVMLQMRALPRLGAARTPAWAASAEPGGMEGEASELPWEHPVIIDFGLARAFYTSAGHAPFRRDEGRAGTARYASIRSNKGYTQSRRDDLEALGYLLVYLAQGSLPWQGVKADARWEKHTRICELKMRTPLSVLCHGMPPCFIMYLQYVRRLTFEEDPDYRYLRSLFDSPAVLAPASCSPRSFHLFAPCRQTHPFDLPFQKGHLATYSSLTQEVASAPASSIHETAESKALPLQASRRAPLVASAEAARRACSPRILGIPLAPKRARTACHEAEGVRPSHSVLTMDTCVEGAHDFVDISSDTIMARFDVELELETVLALREAFGTPNAAAHAEAATPKRKRTEPARKLSYVCAGEANLHTQYLVQSTV
ncbi:hypothetical protein AB1Y20_016007 [Prymnesium parvum]|uniref:non-specific serine/threonine protein kinase n=1 Tax=Prymnesium parvum TaxID=97485 RepID=A0AB34K266_PRYPA